ncbi:ketoacyl-ACP synthase III [Ancylomarina salipaludis]|uniref:Ketoacyl-ACP synthase III n=1 Tax=Ancylomarina salipaludis TaxID=2501299 RepID=A0A4Q1JKY0_9BACT|nr:ketoacyl-ACP synthase III [Ancylomarina salipaludis]RXQ93862.1 ketoacyl-ACP synthase III [Ancylomarina salipaludis]
MEAYIKGISYYLPEKMVTNEDLISQFPEWSVEKITKKLGINERHVASDDETASDMAVNAAEKLIEEYKIDKSSIDYIIFVTQSPDYILPTTACLIQDRLGLPTSIGAIDVNLGCSGFIYGLSLAKGLVLGGMSNNVLLLTSETYSKHIHPKDKGNRTIFGDAAAATLISTDGFAEIKNFSFSTDGKGADNLIVKTGGFRMPKPLDDLTFDEYGNPKSSDYLFMDGSAILTYTLDYLPPIISDNLLKNNLEKEDIDLFVFHQANKYLLELLRKKMRIQKDKYYLYCEKVGNTVSSTIPIALKEAILDETLANKSNVLLAAPGLGYSTGAAVLDFGKHSN